MSISLKNLLHLWALLWHGRVDAALLALKIVINLKIKLLYKGMYIRNTIFH